MRANVGVTISWVPLETRSRYFRCCLTYPKTSQTLYPTRLGIWELHKPNHTNRRKCFNDLSWWRTLISTAPVMLSPGRFQHCAINYSAGLPRRQRSVRDAVVYRKRRGPCARAPTMPREPWPSSLGAATDTQCASAAPGRWAIYMLRGSLGARRRQRRCRFYLGGTRLNIKVPTELMTVKCKCKRTPVAA